MPKSCHSLPLLSAQMSTTHTRHALCVATDVNSIRTDHAWSHRITCSLTASVMQLMSAPSGLSTVSLDNVKEHSLKEEKEKKVNSHDNKVIIKCRRVKPVGHD